jgi:hypothetical protein
MIPAEPVISLMNRFKPVHIFSDVQLLATLCAFEIECQLTAEWFAVPCWAADCGSLSVLTTATKLHNLCVNCKQVTHIKSRNYSRCNMVVLFR